MDDSHYKKFIETILSKYKNSHASGQTKNEKIDSVRGIYAKKADKQNEMKRDPTFVIGEEGAQERDKHYTILLDYFVSNYDNEKKQTIQLKKYFFGVVLVLLALMGLAGIAILIIALFVDSSSSLPIIIGASVDILAAFITIPTIIARNLFPNKLDKQIISVTKLLIENDEHIRKAKKKKEHEEHVRLMKEQNKSKN